MEEFNLAGNETILDLGCGDGTITNQLAEMVPDGNVLGIDASEGMIKIALIDKNQQNVNFELKDINEINYINEFDLLTVEILKIRDVMGLKMLKIGY